MWGLETHPTSVSLGPWEAPLPVLLSSPLSNERAGPDWTSHAGMALTGAGDRDPHRPENQSQGWAAGDWYFYQRGVQRSSQALGSNWPNVL